MEWRRRVKSVIINNSSGQASSEKKVFFRSSLQKSCALFSNSKSRCMVNVRHLALIYCQFTCRSFRSGGKNRKKNESQAKKKIVE